VRPSQVVNSTRPSLSQKSTLYTDYIDSLCCYGHIPSHLSCLRLRPGLRQVLSKTFFRNMLNAHKLSAIFLIDLSKTCSKPVDNFKSRACGVSPLRLRRWGHERRLYQGSEGRVPRPEGPTLRADSEGWMGFLSQLGFRGNAVSRALAEIEFNAF